MSALPLGASAHRDTLPMTVANMPFLVDKLGEDCAPLQHIRELTQNAIDAISQLKTGGEIIWDVAWTHHELDGAYKLSCIDTGAGMTGPEMVQYINALSSSLHQQSATGNFGVGAKIAAAPRNRHGLVYMSWKKGVGSMIHLWFDPEERVYGLKRWAKNNGEFWATVSNDLKPQQIDQHGTVVVLFGRSDEDNTMLAPSGTPMKSRWVLRYLNSRYFRFPENVTVQAREGWDRPRSDSRHNFLRKVEGQGAWLDKNSEDRGTIELTGARAHWWIIKPDIDKDSGHVVPGGHIAALYQNELYEMMHGRGGLARLQAFGAIFGTDRVVIYVEPHTAPDRPVGSNTARTHLLVGGEPLEWASWAAEFRDRMPDALVQLQEQISKQAGQNDHRKAILDRLKQIRDLLRFSRFRPTKDGRDSVEPDSTTGGGEAAPRGLHPEGTRAPGNKGGRAGDIYALFAEAGPITAEPVDGLDAPKPDWVSVAKNTRTPPDLDDRAAKFLLAQNRLLINADFRVFTDMIDRWTRAYAHVPGATAMVEEVVHEWFEQQLIEAVVSAQALKSTGRWSIQELEKLWSEEALTAAVLPRWHIDQSIKRMLGQRLGTLKAA